MINLTCIQKSNFHEFLLCVLHEINLLISFLAELKKICEHWERLDPILRNRPGMAAPFLGDNEDEVDQTVFAHHTADISDEDSHAVADDVLVARGGGGTDCVMVGEEDNRSRAEKKIDGEEFSSDDEDLQQEKLKGGSATKKKRSVEVNKKKKKSPELSEVLLMHAKDRNVRADKKNDLSEKRDNRKFDLQEKKLELEFKRHADAFQIQMDEMELRKRQMRLEEEKAGIRKLELQAMLHAQPGRRFGLSAKFYSLTQAFLLIGTAAKP